MQFPADGHGTAGQLLEDSRCCFRGTATQAEGVFFRCTGACGPYESYGALEVDAGACFGHHFRVNQARQLTPELDAQTLTLADK